MTFEQLRVLQAIVKEGTFRGAARKLYKSQPAISNLIKKLESECGVILFSRDQYRPELTPDGQIFYDKALLVLKEMNQLTSLAKRFSKEEEPLVRIAINAVCPLPVLLNTLKTIDDAFPATELDVSTESMGGAMERLAENSVDIALTTQSDMQTEVMEAIPFMLIPVIPVAHKNYLPVKHGKVNSIDEMRNSVQVVVADSSHTAPKQSLDVMPQVKHWCVTDLEGKKAIIMAGMGWGGLPEHTVKKELASGILIPIHVEGFEIRESQIYMIRRTDQAVGIVAETLWGKLRVFASNFSNENHP